MKAKNGIRRIRLGDGSYLNAPPQSERTRHHETGPGSGVGATPAPNEMAAHGTTRSRLIGMAPGRRKCVMAGCGSVGSHTGMQLAMLGFDLTAFDSQLVDRSNTEGGRSAYPPETVGMSKVAALSHTVRRAGLGIEIVTFRRRMQDFSDIDLRTLAADAGAAVAAFDDMAQLLRLNALLYGVCPVVYPGFHRGGRSGHVIWTRPPAAGEPRVSCFACAMGVRSADELRTLHAASAFPPDIRRVADMAVRVTTWLCSGEGDDVSGLMDPTRNIVFLENRPTGSNARGLTVELLASDRDPSCPICGSLDNEERR